MGKKPRLKLEETLKSDECYLFQKVHLILRYINHIF